LTKNLLIEGMPETGKSTLIGRCIGMYGLRPFCTGYQTARVFGTDRKLRGFTHLPACAELKTELISDDREIPLFIELSQEAEAPAFHKEIFLKDLRQTLASAENFGCVLIDEMGGNELLLPEVTSAYLQVLKGHLPVLGVLKSPEHAKRFAYDAYTAFRETVMKETDTEILCLEKENREEIGHRISEWIRERGLSETGHIGNNGKEKRCHNE